MNASENLGVLPGQVIHKNSIAMEVGMPAQLGFWDAEGLLDEMSAEGFAGGAGFGPGVLSDSDRPVRLCTPHQRWFVIIRFKMGPVRRMMTA